MGYAIALVGMVVVASFVGMGAKNRKKFFDKGL
jgi:hypothetical protein